MNEEQKKCTHEHEVEAISGKEITFEDIKNANACILTTDIKGKGYAEVNQRIKAFRMVYPNGTLMTKLVKNENGVCIFRAYVYDDNSKLLATGTAQEKEDSSFINETSYIENCVPLDTQILTPNGWKYYYQLKEGDKVWSVNLDTKQNELTKVMKINVYKDQPIVELKTSRFNFKCTPQHKWVIIEQTKKIKRTPTNEIKQSDKIIQAFKQEVTSSEIGKKLGWLICDSQLTKTKNGLPSRVEINQSKHIDEIETLFGKGRKTKRTNENWKDNYSWSIPAEDVRAIYGYFDIVDYKDLAKAMCIANIEDVKGCFESMMLADGSKSRFSSTYRELVEAIQIMCARLGIATGNITKRTMPKSTKPIYEISIKKTNGAYFSEINKTNLPPQDVWCPTTENHTWVMKQGNYVSLTSNCETSAVGRALGLAGFGIDTSVASAEEVANAIANQNKPMTKEEALEVRLTFGKFKNKTFKEIIAEDGNNYLNWLLGNSKDEKIIKCCSLILGTINPNEMTEEEKKENLKNISEMNMLLQEMEKNDNNFSREEVYKKYGVLGQKDLKPEDVISIISVLKRKLGIDG